MLAMVSFIGLQAFAQTTVTGTVTDPNGDPVPGANIRVKGFSDAGTITDLNGSFTLNVPAGATTLVFSFVGMKTTEVEISARSIIDFKFETEDFAVDEVVVVAYGVTQKSSFTGSVGVVKSEELGKSTNSTFVNSLQGNVSGVQINTASGQPGASTDIIIRGMGSFGGSSPLYVIDGVPVASGNFSSVASSDYGTSSTILSTLNPSDIESVSILKDASAASLYGSRAANGVVVITTKNGKKGKTSFNVSAKYGITDVTVMPEVLGTSEYFKVFWDAYKVRGTQLGYAGEDLANFTNSSTINVLGINPYNTLSPYNVDGQLNSGARLYWDQNWQDDIVRKGYTQDYVISANGGSEFTNYFISGGYMGNNGNVVGSAFDRYTARMNLGSQVKDFLKIDLNSFFSFTDQDTPPGAGGGASPMSFVNQVANVYPLYAHDSEGNIIYDALGNKVYNYYNATQFDFNPVALAEMDIYNTKTYRMLTGASFEFTFLKDFKITTKPSVDYLHLYETRYYNPLHGNGAAVDGRSNKIMHKDVRFNITNTLNWSRTFGQHNINALLAHEMATYKYDYMEAGGVGFPFPGNDNLIAAGTPTGISSYITEKNIVSYFTRLNYDLANKYYISLGLRRDGSSVFGSNYKYGTFYSVGASWRISEETFLKNITWINNLKLRTSYGTSGNDQIGRYDALGLFGLGPAYDGVAGLTYTQLANPKLRWEKNINFNVGLEFGLFKKFTGEIEYFTRQSDDLITAKPLSLTTGFSSITSNVAKMKNTGMEFSLHSENFRSSDFSWTSDFNFTTIKNEIVELSQKEVLSGSKRWIVGKDRMQFYIEEFAGVDPSDGAPMWYMDIKDADGNPTGERTVTKSYSQASRYEMGSALPKFTGGFANSLMFKGFEFTFNLYFSYGGKILDYTEMDLTHGGAVPGKQLSPSVYDAWKQPGDITSVPRFYVGNTDNGNSRSDRYLHDGSYIRLKNATFAYNFPGSILSKMKISSLRAYISLENYLTLAKYKGLDPELGIDGTSNNYYPQVKALMFGLNLNF